MAKAKSAKTPRSARAARRTASRGSVSRTAPRGAEKIDAQTASRIVKRAAAKQRILISLTEDQFAELVRNFTPEGGGTFDPRRPFQIDFVSGSGTKSRLPVASCAFWSDTCCV